MLMGQLGGELKKSKEDFIDHHNKIYSGNIPTWVIIEILSFGAISKLYKNLLITHKKGIIKIRLYITMNLLRVGYKP